MKRIDAAEEGIFEISWSPDGKWLAYVGEKREVRLAQVETGDIRVIGPGDCPGITADLSVILERDEQIFRVSGGGEQLVAGRDTLVKSSPKRSPSVSPDGKLIAFQVCNVFDKESQAKNAYAYRHFLALAPGDGGAPKMTAEQWYGGTVGWAAGGERFVHFEFDSTGGARSHVVTSAGVRETTVAGLYPSLSPDGKRLAARPRSGGGLVVYSVRESWTGEEAEATVLRIPVEGVSRPSASPAVWLDNRHVVLDEADQVWRLDTRRDKAEAFKKIPAPPRRRRHGMVASPTREQIAVEVEEGDHFELRVFPLV